jgi:hypothetical protein
MLKSAEGAHRFAMITLKFSCASAFARFSCKRVIAIYRQRLQRSFGAEFLCPFDALEDMLAGSP